MGYLQCEHPTKEKILSSILHGDNTHREWLTEALDNLWSGKEVPAPRGSNTSDSLRITIEELEIALRDYADNYTEEDCPVCLRPTDPELKTCFNNSCIIHKVFLKHEGRFKDLPEDIKEEILNSFAGIAQSSLLNEKDSSVAARYQMYKRYILGGPAYDFTELSLYF